MVERRDGVGIAGVGELDEESGDVFGGAGGFAVGHDFLSAGLSRLLHHASPA
jgi:hypothetical protein